MSLQRSDRDAIVEAPAASEESVDYEECLACQ